MIVLKRFTRRAIIVARYQYPGIIDSEIRDYIQTLRRDIWLELNDHLTAYEQVKVFNKIFFKEHKFYGDSKKLPFAREFLHQYCN